MKPDKQEIKRLMNIALSDTQLQNNTQGYVPIVTYNKIYNKSLKKLFESENAIILLYLQERNVGHWVTVIDHGNYIEYFDSYGNYPDEPLTWNSLAKNEQLGQSRPFFLEKVIRTKGCKLYYNSCQLQLHSNDSETCGRYALVRIRHKNKSLQAFLNYLEKKRKQLNLANFDQTVAFLTRDIDRQI